MNLIHINAYWILLKQHNAFHLITYTKELFSNTFIIKSQNTDQVVGTNLLHNLGENRYYEDEACISALGSTCLLFALCVFTFSVSLGLSFLLTCRNIKPPESKGIVDETQVCAHKTESNK